MFLFVFVFEGKDERGLSSTAFRLHHCPSFLFHSLTDTIYLSQLTVNLMKTCYTMTILKRGPRNTKF